MNLYWMTAARYPCEQKHSLVLPIKCTVCSCICEEVQKKEAVKHCCEVYESIISLQLRLQKMKKKKKKLVEKIGLFVFRLYNLRQKKN